MEKETISEEWSKDDKENEIVGSGGFQDSFQIKVNDPNTKKDLDTILAESVGKFGWFQVWLLAILFFCQATFATGVYTSVFSDYTPRHHCVTDMEEEFNLTKWEEESERCALVSDDNLTECSLWAFDKTVMHDTASSMFGIVCDKAVFKTLSGTLKMSGLLVGSFVFGWMSDVYGRVPSLTLAGVLLFISQIIAGFSSNYIMFSVMNIFMAAGGIGAYLISFVLLFEWISPEYRTTASASAQVPFALGFLYTTLIAWLVSSWQPLLFALALPNAAFLIFPFILPESPRWLVSQKKFQKAMKSIRVAAKSNKLYVSEAGIQEKSESSESFGIGVLIAHPVLRYRLLIMSFNWIVVTLCFYGLILNSAGQDLFIGMSSSAAVELVAYILTIFLMDIFGRRPILTICQIVSGCCCVCAGFVPQDFFWIRLFFSSIGKMGASAVFSVIFIYTSELFPTCVRNSAMGLCSTVARIGAMLAPSIAGLDSVLAMLPFLVMGGAAIVAGCVSFALPETRGTRLPETLEQAEAITRNGLVTKQEKK